MKHVIIGILFSSIITCSMGQSIDVEQPARFPGGIAKFLGYLSENITYPKQARKNGVSGIIYMEFFIKENGEVDKDSIRSLSREEVVVRIGESGASNVVFDESLEREAKRVLRNSPRWIPGSMRDIPTRQKMVLPLNFGM